MEENPQVTALCKEDKEATVVYKDGNVCGTER